MSHDSSAYTRHRVGELSRSHEGHGYILGASSIPNGETSSRPQEGERKRNYKLIIDPVLKGRGHQKIYRFDGEFDGQAPVIPKDPRSRRTRLWSTRTKADLPVPKFKIDKFYVGIPPQRDVILNGLNDNVDKKFLSEVCEKFGNIEGIKIFYDPLTKRHLGKARVGFTTSASAKLAVAKLDGTSIMGCIVHADFEHKVEVKHVPKPPPNHCGSDPVHKTPPLIERITGPHVIPTPPPSNSSQSPANSTPSTPGSLGLTDPRRRNSSTGSVTVEKHQGKSPTTWSTNFIPQTKLPVFEPISPPTEKLPLPPPPPPDGPPPPPPEKCRTPSPPPSTAKHDRYQSKDSHSSTKGSRDSYKSSRQNEDSDWRRRDRNSSRDRYDYSSYRRSSTNDRGRDSRYSSHRDHYSREKDSRDSYQRSDSRRASYRDSESRRSRDSDDSYGSEKSFKSSKEISKGRHEHGSEGKDYDGRMRSPRASRSDVFEKEKRETKKSDKAMDKSDGLTSHKDSMNSFEKNFGKSSHEYINRSPSIASPSLKPLSPPTTEKPSGLVVDVVKNLESQTSLQESTNNYVPMVEDISPVSSPTQPKSFSNSFPSPNEVTETISTAVPIESSVDNKVQAMTTEDNDDAMSLSSISSNEETLEVTKPIPVPPPIPFTPTYAPPVLPPPFMPPYNPSIPPPSYPAIPIVPHRIPIPPLSMATLPPPHPLVPPAFQPTFPPQFVSTLSGVPTPPMYQSFPTGRMPSAHEQRPPVRKNWKIRISEEVLKRLTEELALILKKDVNKRLVENSAFKALEGWWDNAQKTKLKKSTQSEIVSTINQPTSLTSTQTSDMTSSALLSTTMSPTGMLGLGLRASLPKMPSFRKRRPPSTSGSDLYAKRKRTEPSPERGKKRAVDSDSEIPGKLREDSMYTTKRRRNDERLNGDVSIGSPWQHDDDVTDELPLTSVEEKRSTVGSSLYTNIYSSLSESESTLTGDESASEDTGDDDSDWDGTERSEGTSDSEEDASEAEETGTEEDKTTTERKIPKTPPGTPPETPPATPPISRTPSDTSITPTASPVDVTTIDEPWKTEDAESFGLIKQEEEGTLGSPKVVAPDLKTEDLADSASGPEVKANKQQGVGTFVSEGDAEGLSEDSSIVFAHKHITQKVKYTSEDSTADSQNFQSPHPDVKVGGQVAPVTKETSSETTYEPVIELPPEFPVRPYWQDDGFVYDFLVSGLDYEDASYMKIGFENLLQVGSDSVVKAHWSFHPTTSPGVLTKGRKQKLENCGVRLHNSGCARCEGYYKISMKEKAKYLEAARRQVTRSQEVLSKKDNEKEANKAKQQSRENRALQRRLAASFQLEDFGDILKFNQLKVRKKKLTFCKSLIHDWGLFALEPIARDEMVIEYVGEVVRQAIADDREKRYERLGIGSSYLFRVDSDTIIDATKYGNLARFINHCCEPNCYAKVVTFESEKKIVIYSKRDIAVNEEITYDYKFPIEDEKIPCLCGAAQCRGTLN